jgi:cytochrome c
MKKFFIVLGITSVVLACNSAGDGDKQASDTAATQANETPAAPSTTTADEKGLELIGASDCTTCHAIDQKKIGPAYIDVAKKYEPTQAVIDTLVSKVIHGGQGVWGQVPMTAHPDLSQEDAREMVKYILSLKNQ